MELMKASSSLYWETVVMLTLGEVSLTCMWVMEFAFFFLYINFSAVKRLIASKIKKIVYRIYVCVLCIFVMYR